MNKSIVLTILVLLSLTIVAIAASSEISLTITSSDPTQNDTTNDLTLESISVDPSIDVYRFNWLKDGQSFAVLNMPFEGSDLISQEDISRRGNAPSGYGDATFSSGTGYDGNGSLYFNGSAQVDIDDSTDINVGIHTEKTVEFWFKASTDFSSSDKQVLYEEGGVARGFNLYLSNGALYLGAWNNVSSESNWTGTFLSSPVNQDQYYHVAAVLDNAGPTVEADKLKLYIDGALVASGDASQLWTHYGDINVGAKTTTIFHDEPESYGPGSFFVGYLDELRIYDDALVFDQIAEHSKGNYPFMDAELTDGFETWQLEAIPLQVSSSGPYYPSNELQVLPVNTDPVANDDTFIVAAGNTVTLDVLANDVDAEGDTIFVTFVGPEATTQGVASLEADGSVVYTAPADFVGADSFAYDVEAVRGGSDFASVNITVVASDTTAPTITAYEPETDVLDRDIVVRVQAQDDVAVDTVRLVLDDASSSTVLDVEMSPEASDNYYSYSIAASTLLAGNYTVNVTANDTSVDVGGPNEAEQVWTLSVFDGSATTYSFTADPAVSELGTSTATITAETTVPNSQFRLFYATSEVDLNATPNSQELNLTGFSGSIALSSLAESTQYFYYVNATSYDGREIQSVTGSFTTSTTPVEASNTGGGSSFSGGNRRTECSDGQDNDNDGLSDLEDPDCSSQNDNSERGSLGLETESEETESEGSQDSSDLVGTDDGTLETTEGAEDALNNGLTGAVVSDVPQGVSSSAARTTIIVLVALVVAGLLGWFVYVKAFAAKKQ